jgi:hypothetical protein
MSARRCLDCSAELATGQRYCANCGQRADTTRLTMRDIALDLLHALWHVDRSVSALLRALLTRPGGVAREYVDGRRRRYFGPFASLVVVVGVTSFLVAATGFQAFTSNAGATPYVETLQRHVNLVILFQAPLLALFCRGLFFSARQRYPEHLVLAAYASTMRAVFVAVVVIPFWYFVRPTIAAPALVFVYWAIWCAYFGVAAAQFYPGKRWLAWCKGVAAAALTQGATTGLVDLAGQLFGGAQ